MSSAAESEKVADTAPVVNEAEPESTAIYDEKRRLYVGNVDFNTTPEEFSAFFEPLKAVEVNLPLNPKTQRGFGFGFVDFKTAEEAEEALNDANGKKLHDRKVFVLVAKPPLSPEQRAAKKAERAARLKQRRKNKTAAGSNSKDGDKENDKGEGSHESSAEEADDGQTTGTSKPPRKGSKPAPRKKGPPEGGVPSKNTVFVANLSFDTTNDQLRDYFSDYNPTWTSVVLRRLPPYIAKKLNARGERRLGRGFGFVRFEDEDTQKKSVAEMDGKEINGRKIVVKVAVDSVEEAAKQALKDILNEKVADGPEGADTSITETETTTTA